MDPHVEEAAECGVSATNKPENRYRRRLTNLQIFAHNNTPLSFIAHYVTVALAKYQRNVNIKPEPGRDLNSNKRSSYRSKNLHNNLIPNHEVNGIMQ